MLYISRCHGNACTRKHRLASFRKQKMAECAKSLMNFTKNYKVFWRESALKTQILKKLKGIFSTSRYKNKQRSGYFVF